MVSAAASSGGASLRVSQELFDETVLENGECFDLSPADALRETIDQFRRQLGGPPVAAVVVDDDQPPPPPRPSPTSVAVSAGGAEAEGRTRNDIAIPPALSHLVLSHPHSKEGRREREYRRRFHDRLALLDGCVGSDGKVNLEASDAEEVIRALDEVGRRCRFGDSPSDRRDYDDDVDDDDNDFETNDDDVKCVVDGSVSVGGGVVAGIARAIVAPGDDGASPVDDDDDAGSLSSTLRDLLRLGTDATRGCESAKVAWVRAVLPSDGESNVDAGGTMQQRGGGASVVVSCLSTPTAADVGPSDVRASTTTEACRLLASLCRYDDFRDVAGPGPNASSAHDHALAFHRAGASTSLIGIARDALSSEDGEELAQRSSSAAVERLASAALAALRVMAVNDEIIQTMVALGVLPVATEALRRGAASDAAEGGVDRVQGRRQRFAEASLGLLRNLCGNDEIKTNLCLGSTTTTNDRPSKSAAPSVLPHVIGAMQTFPSAALVQEHACGTFAAMALRRPANARAILDADGPRFVIAAMKRHDGNVNVQRQGALAIRNIVSRLLRDLPEVDTRETSAIDAAEAGGTGDERRSSIRDAFLELGAEDVLRNVAGRHQGSVDEAYAALRDLGCQDGNGQ
ncbi:hypothetical protein ACHAW5_009660 [Stephanodiscus triporus]|uniref:Armadillo repeat-containing protein 8 n=1 Tax=Stephanodiscus triporus TaxID=2934178 RepID=A0ABD3N1W6_9STRA